MFYSMQAQYDFLHRAILNYAELHHLTESKNEDCQLNTN